MKKFILALLVIMSLTACATKQDRYYSIEQFIADYMATQQVEEVEE